jgi:hypothetical protein
MTKLPEYAEFKAPWEKAGEEIDAEKAKKFLYSLLQQNQTLEGKVSTVTGERDELQNKVDEAAREGESETQRLQRELQTANDKLAKASVESVETIKLRVALEKGLTPFQAKRLVGTTEDEISADADEIKASWGGSGNAGEKDDDEDNSKPPSRQPRRLNNAGDPDPTGDDIDVDKALDSIPRI